ncbi:MAG: uracil-DNA glycosylase [Candidatus Roizmanbacteria bacterium]|nr:MAG: uracil-DNA glycosylase [Candidatus Roizmanbacteria bacterium]
MDKLKKLEAIAKKIENCDECKIGKIGKAVVGEGNPDADIMFIGEAPGKEEAKVGRPFIGRSGKLLRSLIREAGLKEEDVYITSPVKYLPERGTPTKEDIVHGRKYLFEQINIIQPKILVLLGRVATEAVIQEKYPVMKMRGKIIEKDGRKYFLTLHPAAVLRNPPNRKFLIEDFQKLKKLLNS